MMLVIIRSSVLCNLRRIAACVSYRNKMRMKIVRQCNEPKLLSISSPNIAACRIYSTEPDSKPRILPMLVTGASAFIPSPLIPFHFFFVSFMTIPHIDKEFLIPETLDGAKYAITVISKALANEDYDSLEGLVAEDMIEGLRTKIKTLSSEQRQLIAVNEEDVIFHMLCDIAATTDKEHSIEIKIILHYIPAKTRNKLKTATFIDRINPEKILICNYTFTRKYVNNVGGPWIATFVNHFTCVTAV